MRTTCRGCGNTDALSRDGDDVRVRTPEEIQAAVQRTLFDDIHAKIERAATTVAKRIGATIEPEYIHGERQLTLPEGWTIRRFEEEVWKELLPAHPIPTGDDPLVKFEPIVLTEWKKR